MHCQNQNNEQTAANMLSFLQQDRTVEIISINYELIDAAFRCLVHDMKKLGNDGLYVICCDGQMH